MHEVGWLESLKRLAAMASRPPSTRRNTAAVFLALFAGCAVAAVIVARQPEPSAPASHASAGLEPARHETLPPAKIETLALPLTAISVEAAPPTFIERNVKIAQGDTLMAVMLRNGSDRATAHAAIAALAKSYDPRRLRPGQELTLLFEPRKGTGQMPSGAARPALIQLAFAPSVEREIQVSLNDGGRFISKTIDKPLEMRPRRVEGAIDDSLYLAAKRAGMPAPIIVELIRIYSFDVDFQRDIQPGDRFEVLFEAYYDERGEFAKFGEIRYAKLRVRKTDLPLYRFAMRDGEIDYFNDKGHSVRKALMKTPIDGARLTSRFGRRRHPILGYKKMHQGIDFGAPKGTPIMAAGNGVVEMAGWNGGYGRYLRIRHNGRYKTAYAHLSKFRRGIKRGKRVRQGQIVAYVGSTGRSTGPHLHYEILVNNKRINPLSLKLPTGKKLKGRELARFQDVRGATARKFAATPAMTRLAESR
ncbi:MAG: peptidoglycan DD-metalloendopeptidase family protein [Alphaproteobacteria bacterium]